MMDFFFKRALLLGCCLALQVIGVHAAAAIKETILLEVAEPVYGSKPVPVELWTPDSGKNSYPLIIVQHGSTRDGHVFEGGKGQTDVYASRLMKAAIDRGFAVAALDAFFDKGIAPSDKTKFPNAAMYGVKIRMHLLSTHSQLDPAQTFYTGFSYGGDQALAQLASRNTTPWRAVAAAEAGCNSFFKPRALSYPVLIVKGSESHYHPRACQTMATLHQQMGNEVHVSMIDKANHFFSFHGEIVKGLAFNGCASNPVVVDDSAGQMTFLDGTPTTKEDVFARCFTKQSGKGQTREKLDEAITQILDFFSAQLHL